jgi:uncharacterized membrane protein
VVPIAQPFGGQNPSVVRAVLFFSPTCPHCHKVINEDLPPIFESFGGQARVWIDPLVPRGEAAFYLVTNGTLEVLLIDASKQAGGPYYERTTTSFGIPRDRGGVPRLIVGETVLVGSLEIPQQFPIIIREALAGSGLDWPSIEGLKAEIDRIPVDGADVTASDSVPEPEPGPGPQPPPGAATADTAVRPPDRAAPRAPTPPPVSDSTAAAVATPTPARPTATPTTLEQVPVGGETMLDKFRRDPVGNSLSVLVLIAMIVSVVLIATRAPGWTAARLSRAVPIWAVAGLGVALYLTFVEASGTLAVCGPVGDCNAVQQSPYATLFGVIPVGLAGLVGYAAIIATWTIARGSSRTARRATLALFAMTFAGTLFSIYLTFLEPFVIGATCAWCLSSAIIMTILLWLCAGPGTVAWMQLTAVRASPSHGA